MTWRISCVTSWQLKPDDFRQLERKLHVSNKCYILILSTSSSESALSSVVRSSIVFPDMVNCLIAGKKILFLKTNLVSLQFDLKPSVISCSFDDSISCSRSSGKFSSSTFPERVSKHIHDKIKIIAYGSGEQHTFKL